MYGCITTQDTAGEILTVNIDVEFNSFDRNPSSKKYTELFTINTFNGVCE